EEFVLLLADITPEDAELIAQRIQRDLGSRNTVLPTGPKLTMSFGISLITRSFQFEQAMKEADRLLYQAKNAGRDRVHVSGFSYPDISVETHQLWNRHAA
ncbi:diguanylate cyclase domain-containing protein, partial [Comamonas thiooxydans]